MRSTPEWTTVVQDVSFAESPRWHAGQLWFSDMHGHKVFEVDRVGNVHNLLDLPSQPSGLGFRPDGTLLVVSMVDRQVLVTDRGRIRERIDLSPYVPFHCNDMVVDSVGRAYVGNFGYNIYEGEPARPAPLVRVDVDGSVHVVDEGSYFPNGLALTADGTLLIAAETFSNRLTAWDVAPDGSVSGRRVFAELGDRTPDGICLDEEGAVWVACVEAKEVIRVREGGEVAESLATTRNAYACVLGGDDRRTLYVCTAQRGGAASRELSSGKIEFVRVEVPGAGIP